MLVSLSPKALANAKKILPIRTGIIYSRAIENPVRLALSIKANAILPKFELATKELVEKAHRHGLMVFAWTLNTEGDIRRAMEIGVDGLQAIIPALRGVWCGYRVRNSLIYY